LTLPISESRKWKVNKSANEILELVKIELYRKNATLIEANSKRVEATLGSETRTRLFGGAFVSEDTLPVKITFQMNESATETEVEATIQDNLGAGFRIGMRDKYREYIHNLFNLLSAVLGAKN
jgi:hypothetical protein